MQIEFLDIATQVQFSQSKDLRTEETSYVPLPQAKYLVFGDRIISIDMPIQKSRGQCVVGNRRKVNVTSPY